MGGLIIKSVRWHEFTRGDGKEVGHYGFMIHLGEHSVATVIDPIRGVIKFFDPNYGQAAVRSPGVADRAITKKKVVKGHMYLVEKMFDLFMAQYTGDKGMINHYYGNPAPDQPSGLYIEWYAYCRT
jgi:hypothetical protein